jgi:HPt (histidine-containing phosphotransfer) domain-containing protein
MAIMVRQRAIAADPFVAPATDEQAIDLTHLFRMTLGDHGLEREVLALFDRQIGMLIDRMIAHLNAHLNAHLAAADASCVAALAHTLKGSARGVGAWPMARAAEAVETAPPAELAPAVAALAAAAGATRAAIAEILRAA